MTDGIAMTSTAQRSREFEQLLQSHRKIVLKVAASYCRDAHERADLAQEIAAQLWRAFPGYDASRTFSTWMYRIALNVAISFRRGAQHARHTVALDPETHDTIGHDDAAHEQDERVRLLYRCIDALEPLDRALLLLYLDERSQRDIAEILGLTETNVATKIGRLKERLRRELAGA